MTPKIEINHLIYIYIWKKRLCNIILASTSYKIVHLNVSKSGHQISAKNAVNLNKFTKKNYSWVFHYSTLVSVPMLWEIFGAETLETLQMIKLFYASLCQLLK